MADEQLDITLTHECTAVFGNLLTDIDNGFYHCAGLAEDSHHTMVAVIVGKQRELITRKYTSLLVGIALDSTRFYHAETVVARKHSSRSKAPVKSKTLSAQIVGADRIVAMELSSMTRRLLMVRNTFEYRQHVGYRSHSRHLCT